MAQIAMLNRTNYRIIIGKGRSVGTELGLMGGGRIDLLELARRPAAEVEGHAMALGVPICNSVVDAHGNPVPYHRMTGSLLFAIEMSSRKAQTAVAMRINTAEPTALVEPGQPLFSLTSAGGGRYVAFGRGAPMHYWAGAGCSSGC